ncbi:MAG: hypothetical protein R6V06_00360 [Kiritimatiellia bacterium]
MKISSKIPAFGDNYKIGYIGFTFHHNSVVSRGIAYFTRWARMNQIRVSHTLIVVERNRCVEAEKRTGVTEQPLDKYFDETKTSIFFRKPRRYKNALGLKIAETALEQVGSRYDKSLIIAQIMQGCLTGRWVRSIFGDKPDEFISYLLNSDDKWICSELAAYVLNSQPEYKNKGILRKPEFTIDPQELFEDDLIFCKWRGRLRT